jgi:hypothetical protein
MTRRLASNRELLDEDEACVEPTRSSRERRLVADGVDLLKWKRLGRQAVSEVAALECNGPRLDEIGASDARSLAG